MPATTSYDPRELVLVAFPFSSGSLVKARPAMVVLDTGDSDVTVARVTTQLYQTQHDVLLVHWQAAGLLAPSVVRLHKLATLEKSLIHRRLGHLHVNDQADISAVLKRVYGSWK